MSTKTLFWLLVIIIVLGGVWYFWGRSLSTVDVRPPQSQTQTQNTPPAATEPVNSNTSLEQDLNAINMQAQSASDASASLNETDTPVVQTN